MNIKFLPALIVTCLSGATFAGEFTGIHPLQSDRFTFGAGSYFQDVSSDFSVVRPDGGKGSVIDNDSDQSTLSLSAIWRITDKWKLQGEYFDMESSNNRAFSPSIGNLEFAGTIDTGVNADVARLFLGYSFLKSQNSEIGVGAGLHYLSLGVSAKGTASVNGAPFAGVSKSVIDDWAILPNIGLYANYAFSPKWFIGGRVDWLDATIDVYNGSIWNAEAMVQYQMFDHMGIGMAYRYVNFGVEKNDDWQLDIETTGPVLFVTGNF
ncbi:MAG: hypothetical protein DRQ61_06205 [Gammaproteobacteria bacterium]|nr:MAG: hypothetical protein DRQ61_06205 [Gammaproteobacteria bacterium]